MPNGPQSTPLSKILAQRAKQRLPAQAVTYAPAVPVLGAVKSVDGVLPDVNGDVTLSPYDLLPAAPTQTDVNDMQISDRHYTDTQVAPKADKTTTISASTGLTGGGDLSANRSLAVSYGTTAGTSCQGNDSRLSDARPTTTTLDAIPAAVAAVDFNAQNIKNFTSSVNAQTGTTYTVQASDCGKIITCNNASAITVTVDTNLPDGGSVSIAQKGAGQVTISPSGLTIRNNSSFTKTAAQYAVITLFRNGTDLWLTGAGA